MLCPIMFLAPGIPLRSLRGCLRDKGKAGWGRLRGPHPIHPEQQKDFLFSYYLARTSRKKKKNDCVNPCQGEKNRVVVKEDLWYLIYE